MQLSDFDFVLPPEKIAQFPIEPRDASKLLVCHSSGSFEHRQFSEITEYLDQDSVLIFNNAKVLPTRLLGKRKGGEGKVEALLCHRKGLNHWTAILKMSAKCYKGLQLEFENGLIAEIQTSHEERFQREGEVDLFFSGSGLEKKDLEQWLFEFGHVPLPPYVTRQDDHKDKTTYQTVYAEKVGSAAAPTAGFHFTAPLLERLKKNQIEMGFVTLHVGIGTFRPIKVENLDEHIMHEESFEITPEFASWFLGLKKKKIVAVGTTVVRTLESWVRLCEEKGILPGSPESAGIFKTRIFIKPGFRFKVVSDLITNFHLPKSSLLVLVAAAMGHEKSKEAYRLALENDYRFFSYGDAMFIRCLFGEGIEKNVFNS